MTINQFRRWLYRITKYSGDLQALTSERKGAVSRRVGRRVAGWATGRFLLGKLFR